MATDSFAKKKVWIVGASSGIGEQLVYELNERGASLIISSRRESVLQEVKSKCPSSSSNRISILPLDMKDGTSFSEKTKQAWDFYNGIDLLICNAGISQRSGALETKESVEREIFEVNYFGTVALSKAVVSKMLDKKSGHIVVVSSIAGYVGTPLRSTYAASKHALHGYFDALRGELNESGIGITIACPGYVNTNISRNALMGDGSPQMSMDKRTSEGIDARVCAKEIVDAAAKNKVEVWPGGWETYAPYLRTLLPSLAAWIVARIRST